MKIILPANLDKFTFVNVDSCKLSLSKVKLNDKEIYRSFFNEYIEYM